MKEMQLDTLTLRYWQGFQLAPGDLERLSEALIEEEAPLTVEGLARRLMERRLEDEKAAWEDRAAKGRVYQPREVYGEGDQLVFSALGDVVGTVVRVRSGRHPDLAPFDVIQVEVQGSTGSREFASGLSHPHALNIIQADEGADVDLEDLGGVSAMMFERYGQHVVPVVLSALEKNPEFVSFGDQWFLRSFLLPIEEGHRNLAEAVLDLAAGFSTAEQIIDVLEMPAETSRAVQVFSLNHALASDQEERFEFAGTKARMEWCLPRVADSKALRFNRGPKEIALDHALDDVIEINVGAALEEPTEHETPREWSHVLTFYDWHWGHLPYDKDASDLLPDPVLDGQSRSRVQLRSSTTGEVFPATVYYPSERQLGWWGSAELRGFFEKRELAPGATITVARSSSSEDDALYEIDYLAGPATKMEILDYEEGGQPVFRRLSLRCAIDAQRSVPRSRFSALEALRLLSDAERRVTSTLLKTAFQRVGEKRLRGTGIVYRASVDDLFVAANIERPMPETILRAIFEQGAYPCFYVDEDSYLAYNPGRSDAQAAKITLTRDAALLDSEDGSG